jgi:hypothetical protein
MSLRNFSPLAVVIFLLACVGAYFSRIVPVPPIAVVVILALTGIAFQLEDGKLARMIGDFLDAFRDHHDHGHHAH